MRLSTSIGGDMAKPATVTEKHAKASIKEIIEIYSKYNEVYSFCPMTFGYGASGHPDRVILINGKFLGIEVKKDSNNHHCRPELKPKPNEVMQKRQAAAILAAGGEWLCVHNYNLWDLVSLLDKYAIVPHSGFKLVDINKLHKLHSKMG